jgi:thiamine biosynthesis protein ThiI
MTKFLIVRYGEIALKGKNRSYFENKLFHNVKTVLRGIDDIRVTKQHGRIFVEHHEEDTEEVIERVTKVFGIVSVSPAVKVENDIEKIKAVALEEVKQTLEESDYSTFKVESRRSNKGFEFKSPEISRIVGGFINQSIEALQVDVHNPEFVLNVEVRNQSYVYCRVIPGFSGMPYGSAGKGMLLLSGGIDSPVAGWLMAKRGMALEAVHFHSYPFTSERAKEKVMELARIVSEYTGKIRVHNVNLLEIQQAINEHCPEEEMTILSRRFMMAIAERIAGDRGCQALITGESIGQVASQTIQGLTVTNSRVSLPVLRPLIAMDKVDIIKWAKKIGTFETSILPFEDCCTVFLPERVVTRPRVQDIEESEQLLEVEALIENAISSKDVIDIEFEG